MSVIPAQDRVVRYRCKAYDHEGSDHLNALQAEGCGTCGGKRLEVWDTGVGGYGHLLVDWRSQKSVRKKKGAWSEHVERRRRHRQNQNLTTRRSDR
jgi:hypothetical protein